MVKQIYNHFQTLGLLACLQKVSHETCEPNGQNYVDFDGFFDYLNKEEFFKRGDQNSSCDTLLFNLEENHILLVEFKRLSLFEDEAEAKQFFKRFRQKTHLKMSDSLLVLAHYLNTKLDISHDDFYKIAKSFIIVYRPSTDKDSIHKELYSRVVINRNKYLFKNTLSLNNMEFEKSILSAAV